MSINTRTWSSVRRRLEKDEEFDKPKPNAKSFKRLSIMDLDPSNTTVYPLALQLISVPLSTSHVSLYAHMSNPFVAVSALLR